MPLLLLLLIQTDLDDKLNFKRKYKCFEWRYENKYDNLIQHRFRYTHTHTNKCMQAFFLISLSLSLVRLLGSFVRLKSVFGVLALLF